MDKTASTPNSGTGNMESRLTNDSDEDYIRAADLFPKVRPPNRDDLHQRELDYAMQDEQDRLQREQQKKQKEQQQQQLQKEDAGDGNMGKPISSANAADGSSKSTANNLSSTNAVDAPETSSSISGSGGKAGNSSAQRERERESEPKRDREREKDHDRETTGESSRHNSSSSLYNGAVSGSATKKIKEKKKPRKRRKSRNTEDEPSLSDPTNHSPNNSNSNLRYDVEKGEKGSSLYSGNSSKSRLLDNPKYSSKYELTRKNSGNTSISSSKPGPKKGSKKRKEKESKKKSAAADDDGYHHSGRGSFSHRGERESSSKKHGISAPGSASPAFRKHKKLKHHSHSGNNSSNVNNGNSSSYLDPLSHHSIYSPEQATVNDMMRRALEEDQYSALGSVVDTDSSDEEDYYKDYYAAASASYESRNKRTHHSSYNSNSQYNTSTPHHLSGPSNNSSNQTNHGPNSGAGSGSLPGYSRNASVPAPPAVYGMDRTTVQNAMKKRMRLIRAGGNSTTASNLRKRGDIIGGGDRMLVDYEDARCHVVGKGDYAEDQVGPGVGAGGRKKKRKKGKRGISSNKTLDPSSFHTSDNDDQTADANTPNFQSNVHSSSLNDDPYSKNDASSLTKDDDDVEEEGSIFGQTAGSTNATWVVCDKCEKWRRLRGVVDAKKLPSKWYCSMNKNDPERARCSAPEEAYDTPESATDHRARKHLRLWVRRLQSNEAYEARLPTMTRGKRRTNSNKPSEPYEWVRCCSPSCGKWRAILKIMDVNSVMDRARNGEWYCVLNTWDEKFASCAAPQENLPAIGCPTWVRDDNRGENKLVEQDGYRNIDER